MVGFGDVVRGSFDLFTGFGRAAPSRVALSHICQLVAASSSLHSHARGFHFCLQMKGGRVSTYRGASYPTFAPTIQYRKNEGHVRVGTCANLDLYSLSRVPRRQVTRTFTTIYTSPRILLTCRAVDKQKLHIVCTFLFRSNDSITSTSPTSQGALQICRRNCQRNGRLFTHLTKLRCSDDYGGPRQVDNATCSPSTCCGPRTLPLRIGLPPTPSTGPNQPGKRGTGPKHCATATNGTTRISKGQLRSRKVHCRPNRRGRCIVHANCLFGLCNIPRTRTIT